MSGSRGFRRFGFAFAFGAGAGAGAGAGSSRGEWLDAGIGCASSDAAAGEELSAEFNDHGEIVMATMFGTEYAAAPEIIKKEPYTRKVDSWGIGVIMYFTLMGQVCGCARAFYTDQIGVW